MRRSPATALLAWTQLITAPVSAVTKTADPGARTTAARRHAVALSRLDDGASRGGPSPYSAVSSPSVVAAARDAFLRDKAVPRDVVRQPILASWVRSADLLVEPESPELG